MGAIREVKEETNLNIKNPRLFFEYSNVDAQRISSLLHSSLRWNIQAGK